LVIVSSYKWNIVAMNLCLDFTLFRNKMFD